MNLRNLFAEVFPFFLGRCRGNFMGFAVNTFGLSLVRFLSMKLFSEFCQQIDGKREDIGKYA